ncbi:MAG: hypothetical protein F6K55_03215 [Moorea sp. SIO4A3]|nr:hypothetical protein [Moorena sp. SIO4A3]
MKASNREGTRLIGLTREEILENFEFYDGDHWPLSIFIQKAAEVTDERQLKRLESLRAMFQEFNKIQEIVERNIRALLEEEPAITFTDLDLEEIENVPLNLDTQLKNFLRSQKRLAVSMINGSSSKQAIKKTVFKKAVTDALICGRGYIRAYDPQRYNVPLALHAPDPLQVQIGRSYDGFLNWIKYSYRETKDVIRTEHQTVDRNTGLTIFRTLENDSISNTSLGDYRHEEGFLEEEVIEQWVLDLNGGYSIYEIGLTPLVNKSTKRLQNGINGVMTLALNNIFYTIPRTSVTNGMPPGEFVVGPGGQLEFKEKKDVEDAAPGSTDFVPGIPLFNENRDVVNYTNPNIFTHEPFSTEHFLATYETLKRGIYESAHQGFVLRQSQDSNLSGVAHTVLKIDFISLLRDQALVVVEGLRNTYLTSLLMLNQADPSTIAAIKNLDLMIELHIGAGDVLPEDQKEIREDYNAGLVSQFTAINELGRDPDFEMSKIEEENKLNPDLTNPLALLEQVTEDNSNGAAPDPKKVARESSSAN